MLRVKKILEEILPKTTELEQYRVDDYASANNDGMIIYDEYSSKGVFHCMNCKTDFKAPTEGELVCPRCDNKKIRKSRMDSHVGITYRRVEEVDGFIVIKDTQIHYRESVDAGIKVYAEDDSCIVIQGKDIGYFELNTQYRDGVNVGVWTRVKFKKGKYYRYDRYTKNLLPYDEALLENEMMMKLSEFLNHYALYSAYENVMDDSKTTNEESDECPEFDESLISYDMNKINTYHQLYTHNENMGVGTNIKRIHQWCTRCGKYSLHIETRTYATGGCCPHCRDEKSVPSMENGVNYFFTPQEFDDGRLLLRIDEGYSRAFSDDKRIIGQDINVETFFEIRCRWYVLFDLQGKTHIYDENKSPITKFLCKIERYSLNYNAFQCKEEHLQTILNNTAVKRTGFVEYYNRTKVLNFKYFEAMQKIPYLEMFSKIGLACLVDDLIFEKDEDKIPGYIKKIDDKCPFKKLTKPQMRELVENDCHLTTFVNFIQVFKKDPLVSYDDFYYLSSHSNARLVLDALRVGVPGLTVRKMREYIGYVDDAQCCVPSESVQLWVDYLRMLKTLECDLSDSSLVYTNSLKREHDKATRKAEQVKDKKIAEQFKARAEKNEWCEWENKDFCVIVPHEITELYEEGRKLHHCVGTYGKMVANGSCTIAFIRRKEAADVPFCTVEISNGSIVQARGVSNRLATGIPKVKGFMEQWSKAKGLTLNVA